MMCYCKLTGEAVDGVLLTTPACDLVDVPASDTEHTTHVVDYLTNSLKNRFGIQNFDNYTFHSTDNTAGIAHTHPLNSPQPHV